MITVIIHPCNPPYSRCSRKAKLYHFFSALRAESAASFICWVVHLLCFLIVCVIHNLQNNPCWLPRTSLQEALFWSTHFQHTIANWVLSSYKIYRRARVLHKAFQGNVVIQGNLCYGKFKMCFSSESAWLDYIEVA